MIVLDITAVKDDRVAKKYVKDFLQALDYFHKIYSISEFTFVNLTTQTETIHTYKPSAEFSDTDIEHLMNTWRNDICGIRTIGWC